MAIEPIRRRSSVMAWLEQRFNITEMFSFLTSFGLFPAELDTQRPLSEALGEALRKPLPSYARWPRVLGILSLLLFFILIVTGVMLAFYYQPVTSEAYGSVRLIVRDVNFGWFVHQVHNWGGHLLLLFLLLRGWRFFFQGMYKAPREGLWILAILTFLVATHADFTGRLLAWDQQGYWTTVRGLEILYSLPLVGKMFSFLIGGPDIDSLVLVRFYFLHVVILPATLLALFYLSFSGVRRLGLTPAPGPERKGIGAFRRHLYTLLILTLLIFGGLVTLATLRPAAFGLPADPFLTPPDIHPPWYLLASYAFLELSPSVLPTWVAGLALEAMLIGAILLPFIDRSPGRSPSKRRLAIAAGLVVLVLWLAFSAYGYRLEVAG